MCQKLKTQKISVKNQKFILIDAVNLGQVRQVLEAVKNHAIQADIIWLQA